MRKYRRNINKNLCKLDKIKKIKNLQKTLKLGKKQAKEKINQMKKGELTENEVYEQILKNK